MSAERIALFRQDFGPLLRRYRLAAGLTQEELAARAGLSVRGISDLERERKTTPRRETVRLLADALALSPRQRALLEAAARPQTTPFPAPLADAALTPPHNVPTPLTPLIGRERETLALAAALRRPASRLLTLTGPGGVGKTRLALEVAEDALMDFEDGVYVVPLAALRDPALVMQTIGEMVGLRPQPEKPLVAQLAAQLAGKRLLLLLDNFEQVVEAASAVSALLRACPHIRALITSREPLRLDGEQVVPVAPLDGEAACELFMQRALAGNPALELAPADVPLMTAICERVDHLPLAIELAASWTNALSLATLLERLASPLDLLTGGRRDAPERHQTLRETIAWSVRLLAPDERRLFRRLAIFAGGATLAAVEAVCGDAENPAENGTEHETNQILAQLARLVEQNLLLADRRQDEPRFWMLETIQDYAREDLRASGELETLQRRHADYYAQLARALAFNGPDQDTHDRQLMQDMPNIRAALSWCGERRDSALGLRIATPLGRFWYSHGIFDEGGKWLRTFLALDAEAGERAIAPRVRGMALYSLILITLDQRDYAQAEALAREGLALARQHNDGMGIGNMLTELGHVAEARGDLDAAWTLFEEGLASFRASGHEGALGRTLSSLGNLARARGDYTQAQSYLEQSLAWSRERNFSWAFASGLVSLGHVACEQGDPARALALYAEALDLYRETPNPMSLAWCLEGVVVALAALAAISEREQYPAIARLCGAVAGLRARAGAAPAAEWTHFAQAQAAVQQAMGADAFDAACQAGATLASERIITEALTATRIRDAHT